MAIAQKQNEVYTDLEKPTRTLEKTQLEMWLHVVQMVKHGMYQGNIRIQELKDRYTLTPKS